MKNNRRSESRQIGIVRVNSRGTGYIKTRRFKEDIEIENYFLRGALDGDEVLYFLHPKVKNRQPQGEIVKILRRAKNNFVGTIEKSEDIFFLRADNRKMYRDIIILPDPHLKKLVGQKALVKIASWGDHKKNPEGRIVKTLGKAGEHEAEMQSIILDKGFDAAFPPSVKEEAKKSASQAKGRFNEEISRRRDFRKISTFTIDPEDAKDFDDAISLRKLTTDNRKLTTYEVGVHIADVSYYVKEGSLLDKEAEKRSFSIYLVDRTIPMLPEVLSNDLCSLNPDKDRLTFSVVLNIKNNGEVLNCWFGKTVIRSHNRFSYEEAQKVLDHKKGKFFKELNILNEIAKNLREMRFKNGAVDFDTEEVRFELSPGGQPLKVFKKQRLETHKLIEEFMLLANRKVAEFVHERIKIEKGSFLYRVHDLPNRDKIKELAAFLKALGYHLPLRSDGEVSSKDLNALFKKLEGRAEESLIKTAAVRAMAKALYSTKSSGHFGLAFKYYTHFTSPIRRYPDLLVHRFLEKNLAGKKVGYQDFAKYQKLAFDLSEKEVKVAEAERDSIKFKQVEYMKEHIGEVFEGIISGITEWGIYVEELKTKSEGMVKLRDIADDFYELDEKNYQL
ncbi:MAG: ribonuclease R, partial [Parcubacteria group bacterium Gr01-1014_107]